MNLRIPVFLVLLAAVGAQASEPRNVAAMLPLDESEMASVDGGQGLLIDLDLRNNVSAANTPIGCTAVVGTPNPCRFGLEFAARTGTWLMLKEFFGTFELNDLRMDAAFLPAANTAYYNATRFQDVSAACLITGCNPASAPTIKFTFPAADAQNTYADFLSFMNIGRTWLETDLAVSPFTPGYNRDTSLNSVLGVRMSDSSGLNASARMRFWGTGYVYGF